MHRRHGSGTHCCAVRPSPLKPRVHLFVCANRREDGSPLGPGCADAGERLFDILKSEVTRRREYGDVWITRTACMGVCPRRGAAVAMYPRQKLWADATPADAAAIYAQAIADVAEAARDAAEPGGGAP